MTNSNSGGVVSLDFVGIGKALSSHFLQVPRFQRDYAWEEENVTGLFQDIGTAINDKEGVYFLGSIVTISSEHGRLQVVDGQQRLATISALLAAVRDYFTSKNELQRAEVIENGFLLSTSLETLEKEQRLVLNDRDNDYFLNKILKADSLIGTQRSSHEKLSRTAEIATERVMKITQETTDPIGKLNEWVKYIANNVQVVWFTVSDEANAFMIFETLNDRGLDLTISDMLKNYIFSRAGHRIGEAEDLWMFMINTFEAAEKEKLIVPYIHVYWASIYGLTRKSQLYGEIKKEIVGTNQVIDLTRKLAASSRLYTALYNPDHEFWHDIEQSNPKYEVRASIRTLNSLRLDRNQSLLLAVIRHFDNKEIARTLKMMVAWAVRLLFYGGGGGTAEKRYPELAAKVSQGKIKTVDELFTEFSDIIPNDQQFQTAFSTATISRAYLARYLLNALEVHERGNADPELIPNEDPLALNLEHIIPDKPSVNDPISEYAPK